MPLYYASFKVTDDPTAVVKGSYTEEEMEYFKAHIVGMRDGLQPLTFCEESERRDYHMLTRIHTKAELLIARQCSDEWSRNEQLRCVRLNLMILIHSGANAKLGDVMEETVEQFGDPTKIVDINGIEVHLMLKAYLSIDLQSLFTNFSTLRERFTEEELRRMDMRDLFAAMSWKL